MEQAIFIVWRESVEALLVVGILHGWLSRQRRSALTYLYGGVIAGVALAVALGVVLLKLQRLLDGNGQALLGVVTVFVVAALIVQMVCWMRRQGGAVVHRLHVATEDALGRRSGLACALLACLAVTREGAETVVFLYGMSYMQQNLQDWLQFLLAVAAGAALAVITWMLLQQGRSRLSWRHFFRLSEAMLLLLAGALVVEGTDRLIGMGWLPAGIDPLWDSSTLLDDGGRLGGILAALTGYRAYPSLTTVMVFTVFWASVLVLLRRSTGASQARA